MIKEVALDYGIIKTAKIRNEDISSGLVCFVLNEEFNADYPDDNILYAKIACPKPTRVYLNDECIVVKTNEIADNWYCLGFVNQEESKKENFSQQGETTQVLDENFYEVKNANNVLNLNDRFSLINHANEIVSSSIIGSTSKMFLYNNKKIHLESPTVLLQVKNGNLDIVGEKSPSSNDINDYLPINQFYVRSQKAFIRTGNYFNITSGRMKIDLSSSRLSSTIPLKGPKEIFHINAIEGDIRNDVGLGDIILNNFNFKFSNKIQLRCGSKIHPTASGLDLTAKNSKFYLTTTFAAMQSYLEFKSGGKAELFSSRDINVKSVYGKINLSSTQNTSMKALAKIEISANAGIDINSKTALNLKGIVKILVDSAMVEIKGKIVDFSKSGTINMGPKSVAPTGSGPFCALPSCLFTGAPHSGSIAK